MAETWQQLSTEMADMIDGAADSVLRVEARRRLPATGIAWSENLIVTAHHVVETDDDISIGTSDGARIDAELIGRDPRYDLALLRVDATLTPANRARAAADLRIGNLVLALGRPRLQVAATLGIVSGLVSADAARQKRARMRVLFEKSGPGNRSRTKEKKMAEANRKRNRRRLGHPPGRRPYRDRRHHVPRFFRRSPARRRRQGLWYEYIWFRSWLQRSCPARRYL